MKQKVILGIFKKNQIILHDILGAGRITKENSWWTSLLSNNRKFSKQISEGASIIHFVCSILSLFLHFVDLV